ncbi:hypothetical protein ACLM45_13610 [Synechococcus sp. A10-1-5-9]|uniref:hypothetical protein n=1 Tax=Synechococcus sp. A10-1-5-9 TaxID=3392295 RepID=UPI0039E8966B
MKLFNAIATAVFAFCIGNTIPANASIRFQLSGMQYMMVCNDNDPYIYANNNKSWNKSYRADSFAKKISGRIPKGSCDLAVLDPDNKYQAAAGWKIAKGAEAIRMRSAGWDILFDKDSSTPSKFNYPRPLSSACIGQIDKIPVGKIISYCFN